MGFYAAARIVRDACDHGVDTSYYNWCKIAQIAATENSDPHVDPHMSCEKVPGFNLEYKLGPDGDSPEHRSNPAWTSPQQVAVQRDREERNEEDPSEVALRVYDPRIGARRPVRVEPDREPDAQLVRQQRDGDEVDGDDGEKCEEHLADEPNKGISF
jgi:hypothetical protein